jgi:hypothetical protein
LVKFPAEFSIRLRIVRISALASRKRNMVRKGGFEPPRLSAPPPQDGVSASSTTSALRKSTVINILATSFWQVRPVEGISNCARFSHRLRALDVPQSPQVRVASMLPCPVTSCNVKAALYSPASAFPTFGYCLLAAAQSAIPPDQRVRRAIVLELGFRGTL